MGEKERIEKALFEIKIYLITLSKEYPLEHGDYPVLKEDIVLEK